MHFSPLLSLLFPVRGFLLDPEKTIFERLELRWTVSE